MRRPRSRLPLLVACALASAGCESAPEPEAPFATYEAVYHFGADGVVELSARVEVRMGSDGDSPRTFSFGELRIVEPADADEWTLDEVTIADETWPVTVSGQYGLEVRLVLVRAHARTRTQFAPAGVLELTLEERGDDGAAAAPVYVHTSGAARVEFDVCPAPALGDLAAPLDAELAWTATTLAGLADEPTKVAADPLGRVFMTAPFAGPENEPHTRVFDVADGVMAPPLELDAATVSFVPGGGSGPTLAYKTVDPRHGFVHRVARHDAFLEPVWSHDISPGDATTLPRIAASNGLLLVQTKASVPILIDGEPVADAAPLTPHLVLFDESSGDFIRAGTDPGAIHIAGLGKSAFVLATVDKLYKNEIVAIDAELDERWRVPIEQEPLSLTVMDGDVWIEVVGFVRRLDGDTGALVATIPIQRQGTIAPLPDGGVLVGTDKGIGRATATGNWGLATLAKSPVDWCAVETTFFVAQAPGGAVFATRPPFHSGTSVDGLAILGRFEL